MKALVRFSWDPAEYAEYYRVEVHGTSIEIRGGATEHEQECPVGVPMVVTVTAINSLGLGPELYRVYTVPPEEIIEPPVDLPGPITGFTTEVLAYIPEP